MYNLLNCRLTLHFVSGWQAPEPWRSEAKRGLAAIKPTFWHQVAEGAEEQKGSMWLCRN